MQHIEPRHRGLGAKLRELRTRRNLSVRTLAAQVGFSASFVSQLENDAVSPSIASLEKIAGALGVSLGQLFSEIEHTAATRTIIRSEARATYTSTWSASTVAVLTDPSPERSLSALEIRIAPGGASSRQPEARAHDTVALVQQGVLTLISPAGEETLRTGDTAYLAEGQAFAWANHGDAPALLLLVGMRGRVGLANDLLSIAPDTNEPGTPEQQ